MSTDEYEPSDGEVQELIVGLLLDAGDYVRHGQPDPGETLTWNQREVRAWRAARLLSERHAHDARVAREALDGLSAWLGDLAERHPARSAHIPLMQGHITRYTTDNYPEGDDQ